VTFTIICMSLLGFGVCTGYALGYCHRGDVDADRIGKLRRGRLPFDGKLLDRGGR
jgi:hypothetical protein